MEITVDIIAFLPVGAQPPVETQNCAADVVAETADEADITEEGDESEAESAPDGVFVRLSNAHVRLCSFCCWALRMW